MGARKEKKDDEEWLETRGWSGGFSSAAERQETLETGGSASKIERGTSVLVEATTI